MIGMLMSIAMIRVTQPMSMPCTLFVIQRAMAMVSQTMVRISMPLSLPRPAILARISSLLMVTSCEGLKSTRMSRQVMTLAMMAGMPIWMNQPTQLSSTPEAATASGLMTESPVRKISETGTDAAKTVRPILIASTRGIFELEMTTAMTDMIRNARGQGCGMSRLSPKVRMKIPTMMLRYDFTNRSM